MTTTKDKLSASVRMAKAAQQAGTDQPAAEAAPKPAPAKAPAAKPAAAKAAPARAPAQKPAVPASTGEIPESGSTLFPARVWPD
jgi:hypothetical protein